MDGKLCVCTARFGTTGMHTLHGFNEYFDVDEGAAVNLNKVALYLVQIVLSHLQVHGELLIFTAMHTEGLRSLNTERVASYSTRAWCKWCFRNIPSSDRAPYATHTNRKRTHSHASVMLSAYV